MHMGPQNNFELNWLLQATVFYYLFYYEYRHKVPQQNTSKQNPPTYKDLYAMTNCKVRLTSENQWM